MLFGIRVGSVAVLAQAGSRMPSSSQVVSLLLPVLCGYFKARLATIPSQESELVEREVKQVCECVCTSLQGHECYPLIVGLLLGFLFGYLACHHRSSSASVSSAVAGHSSSESQPLIFQNVTTPSSRR